MMTKNSLKIKTILLGIVSILLVIAIIFASKSLYNEVHFDSNEVENKIYGTVSEIGTNYVKIKSIDDENYIVFTNDDVDEGDFVVAYYDKSNDELISDAKIEVIASEDEVTVINDDETKITTTTTTTSTTTTTTTESTTKKSSSDVSVNTTVVTTTSAQDFTAYISQDYDSIDNESDKETLKNKFIKYVDFIFYGTEINGVTFNSLTTQAKDKVLYYVLLMDSKIENKFPNYKENIDAKYENIKSKLISEYMEAATNLCEQDSDKCAIVKQDLEKLKSVCKLSWTSVKNAFSYASKKGISSLKTWYEIYSGK